MPIIGNNFNWQYNVLGVWGRDGRRRWTSLRCPLSLLLRPPGVGKRCLHMRAGGALCRLCIATTMTTAGPIFLAATKRCQCQRPHDGRAGTRGRHREGGGGGGRRIDVAITVSHGSTQAADGDAEPQTYHHGLQPLDPFCALATFSLAIERRVLEKQPLLFVLSSYVHFFCFHLASYFNRLCT